MARPKILVFQHVPYEPLGSLDPLLKSFGFRLRYVNFGRDPTAVPRLDGYDGLVVLGGAMNAYHVEDYPNLLREVEYIKRAIDSERSVLGICLGAQLLATAVGGTVTRNPRREIGWHDIELSDAGRNDPVLAGFERRQRVFQWHEDGIRLPESIPALATSERSAVQAFAVGEHSYGFQFHLEVDEPLIRRWLRVPENHSDLSDAEDPVDQERLLDETSQRIDALQALSVETFTRWIEKFDAAPKRLTLPSR